MEPAKTRIRVAIVEDRADELESLIGLLRRDSGLDCVAGCRSAEEALRILPRCRTDVVLMDIQLPEVSGIEAVRELKLVMPETQFMMLTVVEDHALIFNALSAGATGYLLKNTSPGRLLEAIRELHAGGAPMSGQIARLVVSAFRQVPDSAPANSKLTPMELKVLQLLAAGHLYKEVADKQEIAMGTVRTHISNIYKKLHVHNRTEAVLKGLHPRPA